MGKLTFDIRVLVQISFDMHRYRQYLAYFMSLCYLLSSARMWYYLWFLTLAVLGASVHPMFFAFHLLDVVNQYQQLKNVMRSVLYPYKILLLTVVFYLIVVYIFASIGFFYFRSDFTPEGADVQPRCQDLFSCFWLTLDEGFKHDGGIEFRYIQILT